MPDWTSNSSLKKDTLVFKKQLEATTVFCHHMSECVRSLTLFLWLVLAAMGSHTASINPKLYSNSILRLFKGHNNIVKCEHKVMRQRS